MALGLPQIYPDPLPESEECISGEQGWDLGKPVCRGGEEEEEGWQGISPLTSSPKQALPARTRILHHHGPCSARSLPAPLLLGCTSSAPSPGDPQCPYIGVHELCPISWGSPVSVFWGARALPSILGIPSACVLGCMSSAPFPGDPLLNVLWGAQALLPLLGLASAHILGCTSSWGSPVPIFGVHKLCHLS